MFFCLKLPQSSFKPSSGDVTAVDNTMKLMAMPVIPSQTVFHNGVNLAASFSAASGTPTKDNIRSQQVLPLDQQQRVLKKWISY